jgi:hypothetical protein
MVPGRSAVEKTLGWRAISFLPEGLITNVRRVRILGDWFPVDEAEIAVARERRDGPGGWSVRNEPSVIVFRSGGRQLIAPVAAVEIIERGAA